jgi:hypothetical protein
MGIRRKSSIFMITIYFLAWIAAVASEVIAITIVPFEMGCKRSTCDLRNPASLS